MEKLAAHGSCAARHYSTKVDTCQQAKCTKNEVTL